ncbi:alpha/beta fold hydrolase [Streptomyces sp. NPDC004629]|uniref:alpha/beta fold hydrolase n=1 Tax=Streptomyces sp. NPDC004629 TaxID=3364705 RepID=UPI0036B73DA5
MVDLHIEEWGQGNRTAVLLHGLSGSSRTWWQLAPALAARGYRVLAPDLAGHGKSPRGRYSRERWADDLLANLPAEPSLAVGHSLGGTLLAMVADRLRPALAVYEDPSWYVTEGGFGAAMEWIRTFKDLTLTDLQHTSPHWAQGSYEARLAELADWDPDTTRMDYLETAYLPVVPLVPSLVILPDPSELMPPARAAEFERAGFEIRRVPGTGHNVHVDDFDGFLRALTGWA